MITKKNCGIITVIALLVGGGLGYAGAHFTTSSSARPGAGAFAGRMGGSFAGRTGGGAQGGGLLAGTVAKIDSSSITLNTRDGSSHVVLLTPSTAISKSVTGALGDISVGSNVLITGTANSDGSLSGTMIQLQNGLRSAPTAQN